MSDTDEKLEDSNPLKFLARNNFLVFKPEIIQLAN